MRVIAFLLYRVFFERNFIIENVKTVRNIKWGIKSSVGALWLKPIARALIIDEIRMAPDGTMRSRFDFSDLKSSLKSFVFVKTIIANKKLAHSIEMFVKLRTSIPPPYQLDVKGQNI